MNIGLFIGVLMGVTVVTILNEKMKKDLEKEEKKKKLSAELSLKEPDVKIEKVKKEKLKKPKEKEWLLILFLQKEEVKSI